MEIRTLTKLHCINITMLIKYSLWNKERELTMTTPRKILRLGSQVRSMGTPIKIMHGERFLYNLEKDRAKGGWSQISKYFDERGHHDNINILILVIWYCFATWKDVAEIHNGSWGKFNCWCWTQFKEHMDWVNGFGNPRRIM